MSLIRGSPLSFNGTIKVPTDRLYGQFSSFRTRPAFSYILNQEIIGVELPFRPSLTIGADHCNARCMP
eukprot:3347012-Amphidinium_carterae.1